MWRIVIATILAFAVVASAGSVIDGIPNDHPLSPVGWYTLKILGEVSNLIGLGRTMFGAIVVTLLLCIASILYAKFFLLRPAARSRR